MTKISQFIDALFDKLENKKNKRHGLDLDKEEEEEDKNYYLSNYGLKKILNLFKEEFLARILLKQDILIDGEDTEEVEQNLKTLTVNGVKQSILGKGTIDIVTGGGGEFKQEQSNWAEKDGSKVTYIRNKPSLDDYITNDETRELLDRAISGIVQFTAKEVTELPPLEEAEKGIIYLIRDEEHQNYLEYIFAETEYLLIGTTDIKMENYYDKIEIDNKLSNKVTVEEGKGLSECNYTIAERGILTELQTNVIALDTTVSGLATTTGINSTAITTLSGVTSKNYLSIVTLKGAVAAIEAQLLGLPLLYESTGTAGLYMDALADKLEEEVEKRKKKK